MRQVVLYTRQGCHLCEEVKQVLLAARQKAEFIWSEVDIDADPELHQLYNEQVPVVFIDGRKAFKYHMKESELLRRLQG